MRLRGHWLEYYRGRTHDPRDADAASRLSFAPAIDKKLAWRDLQAIQDRIKDLGLLERQAQPD